MTAGTHQASSIRVAEAAKVIENTQRDVNIALMNELALVFNRIGIDTLEVLEAAGTKWNFLPFRPGLVGGHCIGVDPYYLTHKAQAIGHHPEVILAGRRINDDMGLYVAQQVVKLMIRRAARAARASWCWGSRSRRTARTCATARSSTSCESWRGRRPGRCVRPLGRPADTRHEYGIELKRRLVPAPTTRVVLAVAHRGFPHSGREGRSARDAAGCDLRRQTRVPP